MLTIRKEQVKVFGPISMKSFEDRMVVHLKQVFPDRVSTMQEPALLDTIRHGVQRARTYSIVSERDVCKYIDLAVLYGRDFDQDAALPWAATILQNKSIRKPSTKVDRLFREAKKHNNRAARKEGAR